MESLKERAQAFLSRPIPAELAKTYVAGSMADLLIGACAAGKPLDEEASELVGLCAMEAEFAAESYSTTEAKEYFGECAAILSQM